MPFGNRAQMIQLPTSCTGRSCQEDWMPGRGGLLKGSECWERESRHGSPRSWGKKLHSPGDIESVHNQGPVLIMLGDGKERRSANLGDDPGTDYVLLDVTLSIHAVRIDRHIEIQIHIHMGVVGTPLVCDFFCKPKT